MGNAAAEATRVAPHVAPLGSRRRECRGERLRWLVITPVRAFHIVDHRAARRGERHQQPGYQRSIPHATSRRLAITASRTRVATAVRLHRGEFYTLTLGSALAPALEVAVGVLDVPAQAVSFRRRHRPLRRTARIVFRRRTAIPIPIDPLAGRANFL